MSDSQVVYADHNDRVQDNDLAKEHDFFLWTLSRILGIDLFLLNNRLKVLLFY